MWTKTLIFMSIFSWLLNLPMNKSVFLAKKKRICETRIPLSLHNQQKKWANNK
jgi:hypothetical protein